jgi:hypothetical protein
VRPSGQQCQVSLEKLADHHTDKRECLLGAEALKRNTYVDDIINSEDSIEDCERVAADIEKILARGSMGVKAFSYSGRVPSELVAADGVHVGLAGYLWDTVADTIRLDIGPPRLGKGRRGKRPPPVTGDLKEALAACFTKGWSLD